MEAGPESPPIASIERINSLTNSLAAPDSASFSTNLKGGTGQSLEEAAIPQPPRPRGHHNGRRRNTHDAGVSARRNWSIRHAPEPGARGASGACCAWTGRFFVLEPPWRKPFPEQFMRFCRGRPANRPSGKTGRGGKPKPGSDARAGSRRPGGYFRLPRGCAFLPGDSVGFCSVLSFSRTAKGLAAATSSGGTANAAPGARG